ncbi:hypothetical protein TVAG_491150 [Trichomonas vaginalis G3]|uniref:Uncharacterized protein n=1 Tax=Trichomonas vaginalis (strain ATCC PRA-98 / G3) TaxID=412133 RepID=A2E058_TRIV3|nr:hypothetical protein TVAGG3_0219250 [Trichomonas vaginalis G3]EAY13977.1 hypothetical protein TVAG_491150 [Trichomonas vaginalis G3]KAI5551795.1 hypothetical protein TVAGG3_0219250 [Trichomonas vaginalis G3]|eukprot:XP_001326200.1 hypothetical protein [Trichomonas vaginalis G3]
MQNPWFDVDDFDDSEDANGSCFMGVFNRHPAEIAASLPRPSTPFGYPQRMSIQTKFSDEYSSSSCEAESPVIHSRPQNIFQGSLVSVF